MPEEPTLTHVATTLQFCLEQTALVLTVLSDEKFLHARAKTGVGLAVEDAIIALGKALWTLENAGYHPAQPHTEAEGTPA